MSKKTKTVYAGTGIPWHLIFILAKLTGLTGVAAWSWWWFVFAPVPVLVEILKWVSR